MLISTEPTDIRFAGGAGETCGATASDLVAFLPYLCASASQVVLGTTADQRERILLMASRSIERRIDAAKHRHVMQDSLSSNVPLANLVPKLQARLSSDPSISPQGPQQTTEVQPLLRRPAAETPQKAIPF